MENEPKSRSLIIAILVAALCISGSLVFLGIKMDSRQIDEKYLAAKIQEGIKNFIKEQQKNRQDSQRPDQKEIEKKIQNVRHVSLDRDHIFGNPAAEISLIEYSDFECPFCKRFHPTPGKIVEEYKGKVNWVYRHFPLDFHNPAAQKEAEAAECANELGGNQVFWKYTDALYRNTKSNGKGLPEEKMVSLATDLGIDKTLFNSCRKSGKYASKVKEDFTEGGSIGITGTPGVVILHNRTGQTRFRAGAYPVQEFKPLIDELLKSAVSK
ncbi:MAG: thioredoxin domain-containing protein [SAR324 cluster bacterium]|nr:thioredoxin domain-containing protein [SAR324 cluster bacterium]